MHDISILHNIFLTFNAHLSGLFNSSLGAISDIILVLDHLGTDKSFFEVRMDNTGALRRDVKRPLAVRRAAAV